MKAYPKWEKEINEMIIGIMKKDIKKGEPVTLGDIKQTGIKKVHDWHLTWAGIDFAVPGADRTVNGKDIIGTAVEDSKKNKKRQSVRILLKY